MYLTKGFRPLRQPRHQSVQVDWLLVRGDLLVLAEIKTRARPTVSFPPVSASQIKRLNHQARRLAGRYPRHIIRLDLCLVQPVWPFVRILPNELARYAGSASKTS